VEFKAVTEIFLGSRVLCRYKGQAFKASRSDAVADAAWQAITSWVCSNKSWLQKDIPRMEMVHHQDVTVELRNRLLAAQCEIETLRIRLWNADASIQGYMRMVEGQASDLYTSDTDTWSATSSV
jgi:hypothetical protein